MLEPLALVVLHTACSGGSRDVSHHFCHIRTAVLFGYHVLGSPEEWGLYARSARLHLFRPPSRTSRYGMTSPSGPPPVTAGAKGTFPIYYKNISFNRKKSGLELHSFSNIVVNDICCVIVDIYRGTDQNELIFWLCA